MAKARLYKMVNPGTIKRGGITVKVGDKVVTQPTINFSKNISAINSLGATVNSIAVITEELKETFQEYTVANMTMMQELMEKREDNIDKEKKELKKIKKKELVKKGKKKDKKSEGLQEMLKSTIKASIPTIKAVGKAGLGFITGIAGLFNDLIVKVVAFNVFKWMSNPANKQKLRETIKGIGRIFKFFISVAGFMVNFGIGGLVDFFESPNIFKKIFGFAKFMGVLGLFFAPMAMAKLGIFGAKGVYTLFAKGVLFKLLTSLFKGIGSMVKGLIGLVKGMGLWGMVAAGGLLVTGAMLMNQNDGGEDDLNEVDTEEVTTTDLSSGPGANATYYDDKGEVITDLVAIEEARQKALTKANENNPELTDGPPKMAKGGWINGPMSGYPVSLSGKKVDFIGHGKEYVATPERRAGGGPLGSAFVIPYDTPATRQNPGLTNTRLLEAKSAGFNVAPMAAGGLVGALANTLGRGGDKPPYKKIKSELGADKKTWDTFRRTIAEIESSGKYAVFGGSGDYYDGKYQLGGAAKTDGARIMGLSDPGHSDNPNDFKRKLFRNNKKLQEWLFAGFTIANHKYLQASKAYKDADPLRKLQILAYAHNQGWAGAAKWAETGEVGVDGFGTKGTKYTDAIKASFTEANLIPKDAPITNDKVSGSTGDTSSTEDGPKKPPNFADVFKELGGAEYLSQLIADTKDTGTMLNNNALNEATKTGNSNMVVGDLNPIDASATGATPAKRLSGGGQKYVVPANEYIKPRFGLLAAIAPSPFEIL